MIDMSPEQASAIVKAQATALGFQFCGIAKADFLEQEAPRLEQWLKQGFQGKMKYLENHFDARLDPRKLVPGSKSVVSLIYNYFPENKIESGDGLKIARYAYGNDYHTVIRKKLNELISSLQEQLGEFTGRGFVDSAPVMERQWAQKSGLGWLGKNGLLLNQSMGSFFFLAELIVDLDLVPDAPVRDHCGTCTACIDACPTQAIVQPGVVDSNRCISYLTIELRESIPDEFSGRMDGWIFGCDVCQEVCPWNRFSKKNQEQEFQPKGEWPEFTNREWQEITEEIFKRNFSESAVSRTGFEGLKRNIRMASSPEKKKES